VIDARVALSVAGCDLSVARFGSWDLTVEPRSKVRPGDRGLEVGRHIVEDPCPKASE